jgi:hypothetical protein
LGHEAGEVGGGPQRTPVDLGEAEGGVVGGHDDVGVAHQPDAPAQAVPVDGGDHRHGALVDGGEGGVAAPVGAHQGGEPFGGLHLLDVDPGVEAPALGPQDDHPHGRVLAQRPDRVGQLEPAGHGEGVDRRVVHDDLGDAAVVDVGGDRHGTSLVRGF